jgi:lipoprotein NlpI
LDVPYRTLWGWINESEENRQRYDEARKDQYEMIRVKVDEVVDSMS